MDKPLIKFKENYIKQSCVFQPGGIKIIQPKTVDEYLECLQMPLCISPSCPKDSFGDGAGGGLILSFPAKQIPPPFIPPAAGDTRRTSIVIENHFLRLIEN